MRSISASKRCALAARAPVAAASAVARTALAVSSSSRWAISADRVLGGQHLALLGHLQPPRDGARRQRGDRDVGRPAAAADRAAAAVEEGPRHAVPRAAPRRCRSAPGRSPSPRRGSRRPCSSPSSRSSPPARRRPRAARRGRPAALSSAAIVAGAAVERRAGLEQRHDPQRAPLAAGARPAPPPSSAAAPRAGRRDPRCPRRCRPRARPRGPVEQLARASGTCDHLARGVARSRRCRSGTSGRRSAISRATADRPARASRRAA